MQDNMTMEPAIHIQQIEEALEERKGSDRRHQDKKQVINNEDRRQQDRRHSRSASLKH